jgi:hypothetical protein
MVGLTKWLGIALTVLHLGFIGIVFEVMSKLNALGIYFGFIFFGEGLIQAELG